MKKFQRPLNVLDSGVLDCTCGHYPWDDWEKDALAAGGPKELAGLGRLTVREAVQHDWYDQGKRMTTFALRSPEKARKRWNHLLETDGHRGRYGVKTGEWVSFT